MKIFYKSTYAMQKMLQSILNALNVSDYSDNVSDYSEDVSDHETDH